MRFGARGPSLGAVLLLVGIAALLLFGDGSGEDGGPEEGPAETEGNATARVVDIVDGDTIEVRIDGAVEDVRYIGVDTPETVAPGEPVQCFGHQASEFNASLVEGEEVRLVFDAERRDQYGRLLAYVFVGDLFVNAELVAGGYARTLEIEPNTARADQLGQLEQEAGSKGRGLWGTC